MEISGAPSLHVDTARRPANSVVLSAGQAQLAEATTLAAAAAMSGPILTPALAVAFTQGVPDSIELRVARASADSLAAVTTAAT